MAWKYTTRQHAADFAGIQESGIRDEWSDWVEALIDRRSGKVITEATQTERYDGTGSDTLNLSKTPIISVTAVSILNANALDGLTAILNVSDVVVYDRYIRLQNGEFPYGKKNIEVTYVAGDGLTDYIFEYTECLCIAQIVNFMNNKRVDGSARMATAQRIGETQPRTPSLHRKLNEIINDNIGSRIRFG